MTSIEPILRVENLCKTFGHTAALDGLSVDLRPGELTMLLGPSGSGKSTLFKCITGLVKPDQGEIALLGQRYSGVARKDRDHRLRMVGLVFQQFNLVERLSAIDNVLIGRLGDVSTWRAILRAFPREDRMRALEALETVGLLDQAYQRADCLSGGQQQRVAVARVLTQDCRLVLADEPVASLDPQSAKDVLRSLRKVAHQQGAAVICSIHQLNYATEFADRIVAMRKGRIVADVDGPGFRAHDFQTIYHNAA